MSCIHFPVSFQFDTTGFVRDSGVFYLDTTHIFVVVVVVGVVVVVVVVDGIAVSTS